MKSVVEPAGGPAWCFPRRSDGNVESPLRCGRWNHYQMTMKISLRFSAEAATNNESTVSFTKSGLGLTNGRSVLF
jgi:hypothetical protein